MASVNLDISSKLDITCRRNDTFSLEVIFKDADGDPLPLDTYTEFLMEVRRHNRKTGTATLKMTQTTGEIVGAATGKLTITVASGSMDISGGDYVYDLQATKGGVTTTWLVGKFIINEDVAI